MNTTAPNPPKRSRWMDWKPKAQIFSDFPSGEPTKPSKRDFVGFDGSISAESPKIEAGSVGFDGSIPAKVPEIEAAPEPAGVPWAEWKARALNQIFEEHGNHGPGRKPASITAETVRDGLEREARREHGVTGKPGRITAETIRDGLERAARRAGELEAASMNIAGSFHQLLEKAVRRGTCNSNPS